MFGALAGKPSLGLDEFQEAIKGRRALIIFHSQSCPVCENDKPYLQAIYEEIGDEVRFVAIDVSDPQYKAIVRAYQIRGVPTYIFTDADGNEQDRVVGTITQILQESE